ncbi:MAG: LytR C-terminal domain-containing protein [Candidatus Latescibacterota bacterium]
MKKTYIISSVSLLIIIVSLTSILYPDLFRGNESLKDRSGKTSAGKGMPVAAKPDSTLKVRVSIMNGCGRPGIATIFAQKLRKEGFDVVNGFGENADSFEFDVSVVVDRHGDRKKAEAVAQSLGIKEIIDQRAESPYVIEDVEVVIGRDWNILVIPMEGKSD